VDRVKDRDGYLYSAYAAAFMCAWLNFDNPASAMPGFLRDRRVRQALSLGIDRRAYAQEVFADFVDETAVGSVALPWAYNTTLRNPDYDPRGAERLLASAGYTRDAAGALRGPGGGAVRLVAIVPVNPGYPVDEIAASVQQDFRQLGIAMELQPLEAAALRARWGETRDYDLYFASRILFAGFADQRYYGSEWDVRANPQGRNFGGWRNPEADRLLAQIAREPDLGRQRELLWRFQEVLADDLPALWFGFPRDLILVRQELRGYQPNPMWQYWGTWKLWKVSQGAGVPLRFTSDGAGAPATD
jgi:peptide/nickel transport system substrate-binding protein